MTPTPKFTVRAASERDLPGIIEVMREAGAKPKSKLARLTPAREEAFLDNLRGALSRGPLGLVVAEDENGRIRAALATRRLNRHLNSMQAFACSVSEMKLPHEPHGGILFLEEFVGAGPGRKATPDALRQLLGLLPPGVRELSTVAQTASRERLYRTLGFERAGPSINGIVSLRRKVSE